MRKNTMAALMTAAAFSFVTPTGAQLITNPPPVNPNAGVPNVGVTPPIPAGGLAMEPIRTLVGQQLRGPNGQVIGRLNEVLVDLASGHIMYGLVTTPTKRQQHAVVPQMFAPGGILKITEQQLQGAPIVTAAQGRTFETANFVTRVYNYYGLQPWWGASATGREPATLGNVQKASKLIGVRVLDTAKKPLGAINNVLLDMPHGQLAFLLLNVPGIERPGHVFPMPPMAFTQSGNNLVTGVNKTQLQSAPQVAANNFNALMNPTTAANVYQYYGKQPYWQTGAAQP